MREHPLTIGQAVLWVAAYFGIMLLTTFLDVAVWRRAFPKASAWLNAIAITLCAAVFIDRLRRRYPLRLLSGVTPAGILAAVLCAVLFFLLLDRGLDPILERAFPQSERDYQAAMQGLIRSPLPSLWRVCVVAPVIEEILMRGFVLGGLKTTYGVLAAWLISALLFAVLHFNMVQTLSAFVCGLILGLLYIQTDSIPCCVIAHAGYNFISFAALIFPYIRR